MVCVLQTMTLRQEFSTRETQQESGRTQGFSRLFRLCISSLTKAARSTHVVTFNGEFLFENCFLYLFIRQEDSWLVCKVIIVCRFQEEQWLAYGSEAGA